MSYKNVGSIYISGQRIQWTIKNFFNFKGTNIVSPEFFYAGVNWKLTVYPDGIGENKGWLEMFVLAYSSTHEVSYPVEVGIIGPYGVDVSTTEADLMDKNCYFSRKIADYSVLEQRKDQFAPGGTLTVFCDIRTSADSSEAGTNAGSSALPKPSCSDASTQTEMERSMYQLQQDMEELLLRDKQAELTFRMNGINKLMVQLKELLESGKDSDLTFKIRGREFKAHRTILAFRSPALVEKLEPRLTADVVEIEEHDPDSFEIILQYLYTANVKNLSSKNVAEVYKMARDYCMDELKNICSKFMENNISVENFCDVMCLSMRPGEQELNSVAIQFFLKNSMEIVMTEKWANFLSENIEVGNKLILQALG